MTRNYCREIYEVWAGSEGIPMPETAPETYLLHLVEQMRDIAKEGLRAPPQRECASQVHDRREWQGLTDQELIDLHYEVKRNGMGAFKTEDMYRAIEAKLKEKNHGN